MSEEIVDFLNLHPGLRAWQIASELNREPREVFNDLRKLQRKQLATKKQRRWFPIYRPDPDVLWGFEAEIDARTCDRCRDLHGDTFMEPQIIDKFDYLRKTARFVWRPQVHPNCRCRLIKLVAVKIR